MNPLLASPEVAGFPMTSLLKGTPDAAIWNRAVFGQVELELVSRPAQVVYSLVPSGENIEVSCVCDVSEICIYGCRIGHYTDIKIEYYVSANRYERGDGDTYPIDQAADAVVNFKVPSSSPHTRREPIK